MTGLKVSIITVATEVLKGLVKDVNTPWLVERLSSIGAEVVKASIVRDDIAILTGEIHRSLSISDIVIVVGGLGPTRDDVTRTALSRSLGRELRLSEEALDMLMKYYRRLGVRLDDMRRRMAYMVEGADPIPNPVGAAPGMRIRHGDTQLYVLPGVPREMREMFSRYVEPELVKRTDGVRLRRWEKIVYGWKEADLVRELSRHLEDYLDRIYLKVLILDSGLKLVVEYPPDIEEVVLGTINKVLDSGAGGGI